MKKILIAALLLPMLNSCGDFLTPKQENLIYNDVFWKTQLDAEKAVYGVYAMYRAVKTEFANNIARGDLPLGLFGRPWNAYTIDRWWDEGHYDQVQTNDAQSWGSAGFEGYADWGKHYKVVAEVNIAIKYIAGMPENVFRTGMKDQLLGEAYFLRALVYFDIARIWGNAPLVTEAIESSDQLIDDDMTPYACPRTDDYKIVEQVLSDAKTAEGLLDYDTYGSDTWGIRANKATAEALLGDANLWMNFLAKRDGLPEPDQYITDAVKALEDCVRYGGASYEGYSTTDSLPLFFKDASRESIFQLNVSTEDNESFRIDQGTASHVTHTARVIPLEGGTAMEEGRTKVVVWVNYNTKPLIYPDYDFSNENGVRDVRADLFFDAWTSTYTEEPGNAYNGGATSDPTKTTFLKKYAMMTLDANHMWNEYAPYFAEADVPVYRFTGVKLLLAEAYVKDNQEDKAIAIIDEIRSRANIGAFGGGDVLDEVLQQRISELIGEGQIFYDAVRNNKWPSTAIGMLEAGRYIQEGYYFPVSSNVLMNNTAIKQTPYWDGKTKW